MSIGSHLLACRATMAINMKNRSICRNIKLAWNFAILRRALTQFIAIINCPPTNTARFRKSEDRDRKLRLLKCYLNLWVRYRAHISPIRPKLCESLVKENISEMRRFMRGMTFAGALKMEPGSLILFFLFFNLLRICMRCNTWRIF